MVVTKDSRLCTLYLSPNLPRESIPGVPIVHPKNRRWRDRDSQMTATACSD